MFTPRDNTNKLSVRNGEEVTISCSAKSAKPAATVRVTINGNDVTNSRTEVTPDKEGKRFFRIQCFYNIKIFQIRDYPRRQAN